MASESIDKKVQLSPKEIDQMLAIKDRLSSLKDEKQFDPLKAEIKKLNKLLVDADIKPNLRLSGEIKKRAKTNNFKDEDSETIGQCGGLLATVTETYPDFEETEYKTLLPLIEQLSKVNADDKPKPEPESASKEDFEKFTHKVEDQFEDLSKVLKELTKKVNELGKDKSTAG